MSNHRWDKRGRCMNAGCEARTANRPLPMTVPLATHVQDRDVIPHNLETYDDRDDR